ncbi:MAG: nitrous oxide reductase accessory protein NosL [Leptospiraceae bacterium]|nr:nitrous oxide reductase accessory protein NosL [Leptospiraceae bacterium]
MYKLFGIIVMIFLIIGCKQDKPVPIKSNEHRCEYCRMQIMDMRFDSQAVTDKGRRYYFDSIECLVAWWIQNEAQTKLLWVKNYNNTNEWIELSQAHILRSEKIPSPMGGFFSAYKTENDREENKNKFGGKPYNIDEIKNYIKSEWKKNY